MVGIEHCPQSTLKCNSAPNGTINYSWKQKPLRGKHQKHQTEKLLRAIVWPAGDCLMRETVNTSEGKKPVFLQLLNLEPGT